MTTGLRAFIVVFRTTRKKGAGREKEKQYILLKENQWFDM